METTMQERYYEYMKRRMREEDEKEGIKPMPSVYALEKRIDKLEETVNMLLDKVK